eukprot:1195733-Prorocentrum_minimum.AAC.4
MYTLIRTADATPGMCISMHAVLRVSGLCTEVLYPLAPAHPHSLLANQHTRVKALYPSSCAPAHTWIYLGVAHVHLCTQVLYPPASTSAYPHSRGDTD